MNISEQNPIQWRPKKDARTWFYTLYIHKQDNRICSQLSSILPTKRVARGENQIVSNKSQAFIVNVYFWHWFAYEYMCDKGWEMVEDGNRTAGVSELEWTIEMVSAGCHSFSRQEIPASALIQRNKTIVFVNPIQIVSAQVSQRPQSVRPGNRNSSSLVSPGFKHAKCGSSSCVYRSTFGRVWNILTIEKHFQRATDFPGICAGTLNAHNARGRARCTWCWRPEGRPRWVAIKPMWMKIMITHPVHSRRWHRWKIYNCERFSAKAETTRKRREHFSTYRYIYLNGNSTSKQWSAMRVRFAGLFIEILGAMPTCREPTNSRQTPIQSLPIVERFFAVLVWTCSNRYRRNPIRFKVTLDKHCSVSAFSVAAPPTCVQRREKISRPTHIDAL